MSLDSDERMSAQGSISTLSSQASDSIIDFGPRSLQRQSRYKNAPPELQQELHSFELLYQAAKDENELLEFKNYELLFKIQELEQNQRRILNSLPAEELHLREALASEDCHSESGSRKKSLVDACKDASSGASIDSKEVSLISGRVCL